jgi:hypothetical protein
MKEGRVEGKKGRKEEREREGSTFEGVCQLDVRQAKRAVVHGSDAPVVIVSVVVVVVSNCEGGGGWSREITTRRL